MYRVSDFEGFLFECDDFQTAESQVISRFQLDNLQCLIIEPNGNVLGFNQVYNFDNHYHKSTDVNFPYTNL